MLITQMICGTGIDSDFIFFFIVFPFSRSKSKRIPFAMNAQSISSLLSKEKEAHIQFLQAFTRASSPNPPGDTRKAAEVITRYLHDHDITPEIIAPNPATPNIVSDFVGSKGVGPRLILNGHIDVFPVGDAADWSRDPWSGDVINGRLHGRGTVDMKAGTAASVIAYAYLHKYTEYLKGSIGLCAVSDEETGGKWGSKFLLNEGERWRGDVMINAEPGGLGTIRFAEKGTLRVTFEVKTEGAHGAYLHRSKSATRIAAALIGELAAVEEIVPKLDPELEEYMRRADIRDAVDQAMGKGAADIMFKATLNIGVINGGLKVNMIPAKCVFEADIRLPVGLDQVQVLDVINGILKRYPEVTLIVQDAASNPSSLCSHSHSMVDIIARNAKTATGEKPLAIPSLGATDCKFWRYENVPAYVFGVSPESMAARDESVDVEEFLAVVKTHVLAAWEYLGGEM
jgi:acetylornithine deacetylase/succinyl-diaminopimelate desuccinylase-like protein